MTTMDNVNVSTTSWHRLVLCAALSFLCLGYVRNLHNPLFDRHSFRQTQTAAVIDGLAAGEDFQATTLNVFGPPWVMPVEFPLYQKLTSLLVRAGAGTAVAARLVSMAAFLGCLLVLGRIMREMSFPNIPLTLAAVALFPTYEMWSRACLIESTALLLALVSLALFWEVLQRPPGAGRLLLLLVLSTLAALQKINAYLVVCLFTLFHALLTSRWRSGKVVAQLALVWLANIVALLWWGYATDATRHGNELAERLSGLRHLMMLLGTVRDRFSPSIYLHLLAHGLLADLLLLPIGWYILRRKLHRTVAGGAALCLLGAVAVVHLLFLKVYSVHDYYHFSTTIYVLLGGAFVLSELLPGRRAGLTLAAIAVAGAGANEVIYQRRLELTGKTWREPYALVADALRDTRPDAIVLVLGDDWSSATSYLTGRKT